MPEAHPAQLNRAWLRDRLPFAVVTVTFAASRLAYHLAGVRFDESPLEWYWQFLDVRWLRDDLLRSIWYLHAQPPLFNLYLGVVLKLAPNAHRAVFEASYLALSLVGLLAVTRLLLSVGLGPRAATVVAAVFGASPVWVLYENWLFYTLPVAVAFVVGAWFLERLARQGRIADAAGLFASLAVVVGLRSAFHAVAFLAVLVGVLVALPERRRVTLAGASVPTLAVLGLYAKNLVVFGILSTSSWLGWNLSKLTTLRADPALKRQLVESGQVSPFVDKLPFLDLDSYGLSAPEPVPDVPAVRALRKENGSPNFNAWVVPRISKIYLHDSLQMIRHAPGTYLESVGQAWLLFLVPPSENWVLDGNRSHIAGLSGWYERLVYLAADPTPTDPEELRARAFWRWMFDDPTYPARHAGYGWGVLVLIGLGYGAYRGWRLRADPSARASALILGYCAGIYVYSALVGNLFEIGENNRFRMEVEPLSVILIAAAVSAGVRWVRRRRS